MIDWFQLILGLFVGGVANALWYYFWVNFDEKHLGKYRYIVLSWFEHYHWATLLYMLFIETNFIFFFGLATILLIDEAVAQNHKFGIGSHHEVKSLLIELAIILAWLIYKLIL